MKNQTKILVVDDSIAMRVIVTGFLKKMGLNNITEVEDGEIALLTLRDAELADEPFELIISDWFMPNMTGIELLKQVKADPNLQKIPFLMVTAEGEQKYVEMARKAQVADFIVKPFSLAEVEEKVKKILAVN